MTPIKYLSTHLFINNLLNILLGGGEREMFVMITKIKETRHWLSFWTTMMLLKVADAHLGASWKCQFPGPPELY